MDQFEKDGICTSCFKAKAPAGFIQCQSCRDKLNQRNKARHVVLRTAALEAYGNICVCCGETEKMFLAIDHINNDGGQHRKEVHSGDVFHKWLRDNNYPSGFRLLCHSCNQGRELNGGDCPGDPSIHKLNPAYGQYDLSLQGCPC